MLTPHERIPGVLRNLLLVNIAVFVVGMVAGLVHSAVENQMFEWGALVPDLVWAHGQVWRVFTYQFLHGSPMHLIFNMWALWMFGAPLIWRMGEQRFLALYLVSGVVAGLGSALFYFFGSTGHIPIVGASGAIFGVMLAFARFYPDDQIFVFFVIPLPAKYAVWLFGGISLLFGLQGGGGIAHFTHLFGIVGGLLYLRFEQPVLNLVTKAVVAHEHSQTAKIAVKLESHEEYFDTRVDPILKKISKHGIDTLTREEKAILARASSMKKPQNTVDLRAWRRDRDR